MPHCHLWSFPRFWPRSALPIMLIYVTILICQNKICMIFFMSSFFFFFVFLLIFLFCTSLHPTPCGAMIAIIAMIGLGKGLQHISSTLLMISQYFLINFLLTNYKQIQINSSKIIGYIMWTLQIEYRKVSIWIQTVSIVKTIL